MGTLAGSVEREGGEARDEGVGGVGRAVGVRNGS